MARRVIINIQEFEKFIGFCLPQIYKSFLESSNGGSCRSEVITLSNGIEVLCDVLFGLNKQRELDLLTWNQELREGLPPNSIVIGSSPGGGFYLLVQDITELNVFYYDHAYDFDQSSDYENTFKTNYQLDNLLGLLV
ncbi:SMI1/KNR4 family protein [Thalassotalea ganghwensis]